MYRAHVDDFDAAFNGRSPKTFGDTLSVSSRARGPRTRALRVKSCSERPIQEKFVFSQLGDGPFARKNLKLRFLLGSTPTSPAVPTDTPELPCARGRLGPYAGSRVVVVVLARGEPQTVTEAIFSPESTARAPRSTHAPWWRATSHTHPVPRTSPEHDLREAKSSRAYLSANSAQNAWRRPRWCRAQVVGPRRAPMGANDWPVPL